MCIFWNPAFLAVLILLGLKSNKKYTFSTLYELCEFGFPFAFILSLCTLCAHHLNYDGNMSFMQYTNTHLLVTAGFSPIPFLIVIVFVIEAVMTTHIIDVLLSFAIAVGIFDVSQTPDNQTNLISLILSLFALTVRLTLLASTAKTSTIAIEKTSELTDEPASEV
jgi:hypothetical protein